MPTSREQSAGRGLPLAARRVFRLSFCTAISLFIGYAMAMPLPFLAPMFALFLGLKPAPPIGFKGLAGLLLVVGLSLGMGLLLIPLLINYPFSAILIAALGIYFSFYLTVIVGQALVGTFLTVGVTMISAAGTADFALAVVIIQSLCLAIIVAVASQWIVYFWFPEDPVSVDSEKAAGEKEKQVGNDNSNWIALRATLIVLPAYFIALVNPGMYLAIIMKSVSLGQQASSMHARDAGRELLGSTFMAGCFAVLFWFLLDLVTTIWFFAGWMLLFSLYFTSKIYGIIASRYPPSYWLNVVVTMLILLGPAVEDSANGNDVYAAFAVRMGLFVAVTVYACFAIYLLEWMRYHRIQGKSSSVIHA